jgi:hypothetical protein
MGRVDLGRVQGKSIAQIVKVCSNEKTDTYEVRLEDNVPAGQFDVTHGNDGRNGTNGTNGTNGKDGERGKDGSIITSKGMLVEVFNADTKSDLPIDTISSASVNIPLSANMGKHLNDIKAPNNHAVSGTNYGRSTASLFGHAKASNAIPIMDGGNGNVGVDNGNYAREGHVHPTDTTRAATTHNHDASHINAGMLPVTRGGTGASTPAQARENLGFLDIIYPVGSIYLSVELSTAAQVRDVFGGTWVAWGGGRVPIGMGTGTALEPNNISGEMARSPLSQIIVERRGGNKDAEIVQHNHTVTQSGSHTHTFGVYSYQGTTPHIGIRTEGASNSRTKLTDATWMDNSGDHIHSINNTGVSGINANLPPYITCYMWKRTG